MALCQQKGLPLDLWPLTLTLDPSQGSNPPANPLSLCFSRPVWKSLGHPQVQVAGQDWVMWRVAFVPLKEESVAEKDDRGGRENEEVESLLFCPCQREERDRISFVSSLIPSLSNQKHWVTGTSHHVRGTWILIRFYHWSLSRKTPVHQKCIFNIRNWSIKKKASHEINYSSENHYCCKFLNLLQNLIITLLSQRGDCKCKDVTSFCAEHISLILFCSLNYQNNCSNMVHYILPNVCGHLEWIVRRDETKFENVQTR